MELDLAPRPPATHGSVVVGFGGGPQSHAALAWAVVRAAARGNTLVVVRVVAPHALGVDPYGVTPWPFSYDALEAAAAALGGAVASVRGDVPGLVVRGRLLVGSPARALIVEGRRADLLVVGRRVGRARRCSVPWSIEARLSRAAAGRLVIIAEDDELLV